MAIKKNVMHSKLSNIPSRLEKRVKKLFNFDRVPFLQSVCGYWKTKRNLRNNSNKVGRKLEIGPGEKRIPGFETLDIVNGSQVDYVLDATLQLPFADNTFEIIYASHILEHIPWYQTKDVLCEWTRILKPNGWLEIWVPDGVKICKALVDFELFGDNYINLDGWYRFNPEKDPCVWASGRIFTYGDGTGKSSHPNWHRALFSRRYLMLLLSRVGLHEIHEMSITQIRSDNHGWINLGISGVKK